MRTALIGHRGVGKSSLLARISVYLRDAGQGIVALDLDQEIARRVGKTPSEIFRELGEAEFRRCELQVFAEIERETQGVQGPVFLSLGAGFDLSQLPQSWRALWIRRSTDQRGRIFVNAERPRLNPEVHPLEEFRERFEAREKMYRERADEVLFLEEGLEVADAIERDFFLGRFAELGGALTVLPENLRRNSFGEWLQRRQPWGFKWFELRDDLLSPQQFATALAALPHKQVLISLRKAVTDETVVSLIQGSYAFDWPLELGDCSVAQPTVLSLHERLPGQSLGDALARFPVGSSALCKAALPVENFQELAEGHNWQQSDPKRRVFLPLSPDGRWAWYRLLMAPATELGFLRESNGSGADQPTLMQWARRMRTRGERFAAVLGDPVAHSRTPLEQAEFFAQVHAPVFAIRISADEWSAGALEFLRTLGLRWAAVTAPLKTQAFAVCAQRNVVATQLGSANTLFWDEGSGWQGANTDLEGFRSLLAGETLDRVAIWGGGGTLAMMQAVLPEAECFSARSGENRVPSKLAAHEFEPNTVIWASSETGDLPVNWKPSFVIDLNYFEDSPARAFALSRGARYVSGLRMFRVQAQAQREFWREHLAAILDEGEKK